MDKKHVNSVEQKTITNLDIQLKSLIDTKNIPKIDVKSVLQVESKSITRAPELKVSRKLTDDEKKYLINLANETFKLDDKEFPEKKDLKSKDILVSVANALKQKYKILTLFNSNKLLFIAKHIMQSKYDFKKNSKSVLSKKQILDKINKLSKQLSELEASESVDDDCDDNADF